MSENKPEKKYRSGGVVATIWKNEKEKDGKKMEFYTINIERSYKDKNDEWATTNSYKSNDLHKVISVCQKSFDYLFIKEE